MEFEQFSVFFFFFFEQSIDSAVLQAWMAQETEEEDTETDCGGRFSFFLCTDSVHQTTSCFQLVLRGPCSSAAVEQQ